MNVPASLTRQRRLIDAVAMLIVSAVSFALLLYVGYGEGIRTYERFQIERLIAQGEQVRDSLESYLRPGLPIRQFAGFGNIAEPILSSDLTVKSILVTDAAGQPIFVQGDKEQGVFDSSLDVPTYPESVRRDGDIVQTILPLHNRFEAVGKLVLTMNVAAIRSQVAAKFRLLELIALIASLGFAAFTYLPGHYARQHGRAILRTAFAVSFSIVAGALVYTLLTLYSSGLQAKARSITAALAGRLDDIAALNLDYKDFDGLEQVLLDFQRLNPEMSSIAITIDKVSFMHTMKQAIGKPWESDSATFAIPIVLSPPQAAHEIVLQAEILRSGVYWQVARAIKNFAALFLASALLAGFFMELGRVLQMRVAERIVQTDATPDGKSAGRIDDVTANSLVKPAFFLAVFADSLMYPFLPQITFAAARTFGASNSFASLPFVLYYLCFAAALIPAAKFERRVGSRRLITLGLVLSGISYISLALVSTFPMLVAARALAGIGQGVLFIGVQSYVLANTSYDKRTQAAGIIVFGFQAGTLSGLAIGSLLVSQLGVQGVCNLAASVAALTAFYVVGILPAGEAAREPLTAPRRYGVLREILMMLRDNQFLRSMAFIGVPAKSIMTGVILFMLPLLLSRHGFANEDIGQMTMGYAASVLWASNVVARHADRNGGIKNILFYGALLSSVGLFAVAVGGQIDHAVWQVAVVAAGVCLVGVAHGFINAPVVIHVSDAEISTALGATNVAATYRLMERIGHVIGPAIVGQMLIVFGQDWSTVSWIAGGVGVLALLFAATDRTAAASSCHVEMSR